MNLTLAVDDRTVERARCAAQAMGKSLNQVVREYLEQLAGRDQIERDSRVSRAFEATRRQIVERMEVQS